MSKKYKIYMQGKENMRGRTEIARKFDLKSKHWAVISLPENQLCRKIERQIKSFP
jgi:hypothetical protein